MQQNHIGSYGFRSLFLVNTKVTVMHNMAHFKGLVSELGVRLQNNVASRACASFSNGVASPAIAYFSTKKIRVISLSRHRVLRQ